MKAADVHEGALLLWQPRKYGTDEKVRVIDPRPVFGRHNKWDRGLSEGQGTGVLVAVLDDKGQEVRRAAAQLRALVGPYDEVVKRRKAEEQAAERARREAEEERRRRERRGDALARKARTRLGVHARRSWHDYSDTIEVPTDQFAAMVEYLAERGWKAPGGSGDDE